MSQTQIEMRSPPKFSEYIAVQYEEFDPEAFFQEIMPYIRTPHRCYRIEEENKKQSTLYLLIGITHPVEFRITLENKQICELEKKLRAYGFKKAKWEWK